MYRHPNETVQWNEIFDNQFDKVLACENEIYLMGDFNCDLLQVNIKNTWLEYYGIICTLRDVCYNARWFWTTVCYRFQTKHF